MNNLPAGSALQKDILEVIKAGNRAKNLTRQLLAFSKTSPQKPAIININDVIGEMHNMLSRIIGENISMVFMPDKDLWNIHADLGNIEQLLLNLIINAKEAMPQGGTLKIETKNHLRDTQGEDQKDQYQICVRIGDSGIGIEKSEITKIFDPFYSTKSKSKGTGLGLSTVYGIVHQMNGTITVTSIVGEGTSFDILLPATLEKVALPESSDEAVELMGNGEHILIVEDDIPILRMIGKAASRNGYKTSLANSAEQALKLLDSGILPQLLITDVVLTGINGFELANRITQKLPTIKVILISGYASDNINEQILAHQSYHFLQKPFTSFSLASQIKKVLSLSTAKQLSFLMIDDDENIRILMQRACHKRSHRFAGAGNITEALVQLATYSFDVLLVDMILRADDGISVLRAIREKGFSTPAMIISGVLVELPSEIQKELGIIAIVEKESRSIKVVEKIESYL